MQYCPQCGSPDISTRIPPGDNRPRRVCAECGYVHYQNPRNVAGCLLEWQGRVLLCRRAIEPRYGKWTLPAGFMENGETTAEAAARETREEACAEPANLRLYCMFSLPHISQVYIIYRGELRAGVHRAGEESLATELYGEGEVPWAELAFPVVGESLRLYFADRRKGDFSVHTGDIVRRGGRALEIRHD